MNITLDREVKPGHCDSCKSDFANVRGSLFESGSPIALYLIALHGHTPSRKRAQLALGFLDRSAPGSMPVAVALDVVRIDRQTTYRFVDWTRSPWASETYLGVQLNRNEALANKNKTVLIRLAEHVVNGLPEVQKYLL